MIKAQAGDVMQVRGTSLLSRLIIALQSRGIETAFASHTAEVFEEEDRILVLDIHWPENTVWEFDEYLTHLRATGKHFMLLRPAVDGVPWRLTNEQKRTLATGYRNIQPAKYGWLDIIKIALLVLSSKARVFKNSKVEFFCSDAWHKMFCRATCWLPHCMRNKRFVAPLHIERALRGNEFVQVREDMPHSEPLTVEYPYGIGVKVLTEYGA